MITNKTNITLEQMFTLLWVHSTQCF